MGTNLLRKNKGNETSLKLKAHTFYLFFPQLKSATIRIPLMSQNALLCLKGDADACSRIHAAQRLAPSSHCR